jgi:glycosyltransferase involved in cell wall biosynthesis
VHIVHTESVKAFGGQSLRLIAEARQLTQRGHRCTIVGPAGSEFHRQAPADVSFVPFSFHSKKLKANPVNISRAWRLLRGLGPDVVHTHSSRDAWAFGAAARLLRIPIVRGRHVLKPVPPWGPSRLVYTRLADAFTVSGPSVGRALVESGVADPQEVFITGGCVNLDRFDPQGVDPSFLRRELGIPAGARVIGTACNVRTMKGVDVVLSAFDELSRVETGTPLHLVHAGSGKASFFAPHQARHPGRIHVLGFRHDIERVIGGLDVFVLGSRSHEGISQVLCQAMALGIPVVATRAGGNSDLVVPGRTGFLVEADDPLQLAAGIRSALELGGDEREALLARARQLVRDEYSLDTAVGRYIEAYEQVVSRAHGRRPRRTTLSSSRASPSRGDPGRQSRKEHPARIRGDSP